MNTIIDFTSKNGFRPLEYYSLKRHAPPVYSKEWVIPVSMSAWSALLVEEIIGIFASNGFEIDIKTPGRDDYYFYTNFVYNGAFLDGLSVIIDNPEGKEYRGEFMTNTFIFPENHRNVLLSFVCFGTSISVVACSSKRIEHEVLSYIENSIDIITGIMNKAGTGKQKHTGNINFICDDGDGLTLLNSRIKPEKAQIDFDKHYNSGFEQKSEKIIKELSDMNKTGIIFLHGPPGTGKTTYLRYLINTLEKRVIYIPPDMNHLISSPKFLPFLFKYPKSILIIEDAEKILLDREAYGENPAVSNLLNISDGIMGDSLKFQIICTFNSSIEKIDKALYRSNRMLAEHYFDLLDEDKTESLVRELYGDQFFPLDEKSMSVSDIFGMKETADDNSFKTITKKGRIGF